MKIKIKFNLHNQFFDWFLIPTILIGARSPELNPYRYGVGIGILWLKAKFQIIFLFKKMEVKEFIFRESEF